MQVDGAKDATVSALDLDPSQVVHRGLGAPTGLSMLEHFHWAQQFTNPPAANAVSQIDADLQRAIDFECSTTSSDIDAFREGRWKIIEDLFERTRGDRQQQWLVDNEPAEDSLAAQINCAFIRELIYLTGFEEEDPAMGYEIAGFPLAGMLPRASPQSLPVFKVLPNALCV